MDMAPEALGVDSWRCCLPGEPFRLVGRWWLAGRWRGGVAVGTGVVLSRHALRRGRHMCSRGGAVGALKCQLTPPRKSVFTTKKQSLDQMGIRVLKHIFQFGSWGPYFLDTDLGATTFFCRA